MSEKTVLAIDLAIAKLREQMRSGKANTQIANIQLGELEDQRQAYLQEMKFADADSDEDRVDK